MRKRAIGRPKLPASDRRTERIGVLLRPAEAAAVCRAARECGLPITSYIRVRLGLPPT